MGYGAWFILKKKLLLPYCHIDTTKEKIMKITALKINQGKDINESSVFTTSSHCIYLLHIRQYKTYILISIKEKNHTFQNQLICLLLTYINVSVILLNF